MADPISATPSYIPLLTIETFLTQHPESTVKWNKLITQAFTTIEDQKRGYVVKSMHILNTQEWIGEKTDPNQENEFPRDFSEVIESGNYPYNVDRLKKWNNKVPDNILSAQLQILSDSLIYDIRDFIEIRKGAAIEATLPGPLTVKTDKRPINEFISDITTDLVKYFLATAIESSQPMMSVRA